jgi:predicted Zn-dependent protease
LKKTISAILLSFVLFSSSAFLPFDSEKLSEELARAYQLYYNFQFREALQALDSYLAAHPDDLRGLFLKDEAHWLMALNKEDDEELYKRFNKVNEDTISKARSLLKKKRHDSLALFVLGASYSRQGMLLGKRLENRKAINKILKGRNYLDKLKKTQPDFYDVYTTLGICDYFVATRSKAIQVISAVAYDLYGDKERGKKRLRLAMERGIYTRNEAKFYLALFLMRYEQNYIEAYPLVKELHEQYPGNLMYYGSFAYLLRRFKKYEEAERIYREILDRVEREDLYSEEGVNTTRYFLSECLRKEGKYEEAMSILKGLIEKKAEKPDWLLPYAYLDTGRCLDMLERRKEAIKYYRCVVTRLPDKQDSHQKAFKYLKEPFREQYIGDIDFDPPSDGN